MVGQSGSQSKNSQVSGSSTFFRSTRSRTSHHTPHITDGGWQSCPVDPEPRGVWLCGQQGCHVSLAGVVFVWWWWLVVFVCSSLPSHALMPQRSCWDSMWIPSIQCISPTTRVRSIHTNTHTHTHLHRSRPLSGYPTFAGKRLQAEELVQITQALEKNGLLHHTHLLTGV